MGLGHTLSLILGIDETYWSQAISKLRVEKNALEWIRAQSSMVAQMKTRGSLKNRWWWVNLEEGEAERRHPHTARLDGYCCTSESRSVTQQSRLSAIR